LKFNLIKSKKRKKQIMVGRIGLPSKYWTHKLIAVNDIVSAENIAYLIKYDLFMGFMKSNV
jgi:hypothetical protein